MMPLNPSLIAQMTRDEKKYNRCKGFDGWKPPKLRPVKVGRGENAPAL